LEALVAATRTGLAHDLRLGGACPLMLSRINQLSYVLPDCSPRHPPHSIPVVAECAARRPGDVLVSAVMPTEPHRDADTDGYDVEVFMESMPYAVIMKVGTCSDQLHVMGALRFHNSKTALPHQHLTRELLVCVPCTP